MWNCYKKYIKQYILAVAVWWEETDWVIFVSKILFSGSHAFPGQSTAQEANTPRAPQELTISLYLKVATQYKLTYYAIKFTGKFVLLCPAFPGQWLLKPLPRKGLLLYDSLHIKSTICTSYISQKANFLLKNIKEIIIFTDVSLSWAVAYFEVKISSQSL